MRRKPVKRREKERKQKEQNGLVEKSIEMMKRKFGKENLGDVTSSVAVIYGSDEEKDAFVVCVQNGCFCNLKHLDLHDAKFGNDRMKGICLAMKENELPKVTQLSINGNNLSDEIASDLIEGLKGISNQLICFWFYCNHFSDEKALEIIKMSNLNKLRQLWIQLHVDQNELKKYVPKNCYVRGCENNGSIKWNFAK